MTTDNPQWFTSSYSSNGGQCIEVAFNLVAQRGVVPVRDSKNTTGPVLNIPSTSFTTFVAGVRGGEFDAV